MADTKLSSPADGDNIKATLAEKATDVEQRYVDTSTTQGIRENYDESTYGDSDGGDYVGISVGRYIKAYDENHIRIGAGYTIDHSETLDPTDKNTSVGTTETTTSPLTVVVPKVVVPNETKQLYKELELDSSGNVITPADEQTAESVKKLADQIATLPEYTSVNMTSSVDANNVLHNVTKDSLTGFGSLNTNAQIELTTQTSMGCRPEHEPKASDLESITTELESFPEMEDMLKRLEDLLSAPTDIYEDVEEVQMCKLTEKVANGSGAFDELNTAMTNQLRYGLEQGILDKADLRAVYSTGLQQALQTSMQFVLQKDQAYWANQMVKAQMINANIQALLTKAELIMMPTKVKLAYAQLQAQLRQLDLLDMQVKQAKYEIPRIAAQTDQIREQTALICQQKKLAAEQLAQAEFDRKLKQEQVINSELDNQIKKESVAQAVQQTKLVNTQVQSALKDIKIKDAQLIQMQAQLKLQAQQLLKDKEQVALIRAQVASQYANITALQEQIKVARAQYSDTINGETVGGVIGAQIRVNKAQAAGFDKSAMNNFVSLLQSGWSAKKTADIATMSPNAFNALGVDRIMNWYATKYFDLPNDVFKMPSGYADYLTDDEMDVNSATATSDNSKFASSGKKTIQE